MQDEYQDEQPAEESAAAEVEATEQEQQPQEPQKGSPEYNWRAMREEASRRDRELELERRRSIELEEKLKYIEAEKNRLPDLDPDDYVEHKRLQAFEKAQLEKLSTLENRLVEMTLKSRFNDFEDVVTEETLRELASTEPSIYKSIMSNPDMGAKGEAAYKAIKTFVGEKKDYSQEKAKIAQNKSKPASSSSSPSPVHDANAWVAPDESAKKQLYKEMMACINRAY